MQIQSTRKTVTVAFIFAALSGISSIGNANLQKVEVESVKVSYADLNLQQQEDQETLYHRLRRAADEVCGDDESRNLAAMRERRECHKAAVDGALQQVGSNQLSALHSN